MRILRVLLSFLGCDALFKVQGIKGVVGVSLLIGRVGFVVSRLI